MRLQGSQIYLRHLDESDAAALADLEEHNRAFFAPYTTTKSDDFYTVEAQEHRIEAMLEAQANDEAYTLGLFEQGSDGLVGLVSLTEVMRGPLQSCWLGYYLDQSRNGRGYTSQAVQLTVTYAFDALKLHRIEAGVMPHNTGSIRVLEKAGFEREGLNRKNVHINGKWEDHLHFAIINPDD